jgi:hypothetical protein
MKVLSIVLHPSAASTAVGSGTLEYRDPEEWDFNVQGIYILLKDGMEIHFNTQHVIAVTCRDEPDEEEIVGTPDDI